MNKKTVIIIIAVVLVLCCCVITALGAGVVYYNSQNNPVTPTPTVIPLLTATPVSELIITNTPAVKAPAITTLNDTFDNNINGWTIGSRKGDFSTTNEYILGGKLHMDTTATSSVFAYDTLTTQPLTNIDISVQIKQTSGPDDADGGLIFRCLDSKNYYIFAISEGLQEYSLRAIKADEWIHVTDWKSSTYIYKTLPNTIRVVASGNVISMFINGTLVDTVTDSSVTAGGDVGLGADYFNANDHGSFEFDNFIVKSL